MAHGKQYINFMLEETNEIIDFIDKISNKMSTYIKENNKSKYVLFYKNITHSDLATFGKATKKDMHEKNLLYYLDVEAMKAIEETTNKPFQTAHQSCIGLKSKLYEAVKLPSPRNGEPYLINDYMEVLLVNENLEYFSSKYTEEIFNKTKKSIDSRAKANWDFDNLDVKLTNGDFTNIELHCAVHGLGMSGDEDFHKLRHHIFKGDTFILLFELKDDNPKMFILLDKNPIFYSLIGQTNKAYEDYQHRLRDRIVKETILKAESVGRNVLNSAEDEVTRQQQSAWRKMLAKEMMGYTQSDDQVFCPFTYITADFNDLGALFRASHIKGFSDYNTSNEEKYDINNGLLLSANADALFDKHLISINSKKELVFSFLLDGDIRLKNQLLLLQPIFQPVLNESRMKYIEYHFKKFNFLEKERKK